MRQLRTGPRQQAVVYRQLDLTDDRQLVFNEQVVISMNAAANRVLHRQHAMAGASLADSREHLLEAAARQGVSVRRKPPRGRFAVGAGLSLECDSHVRVS